MPGPSRRSIRSDTRPRPVWDTNYGQNSPRLPHWASTAPKAPLPIAGGWDMRGSTNEHQQLLDANRKIDEEMRRRFLAGLPKNAAPVPTSTASRGGGGGGVAVAPVDPNAGINQMFNDQLAFLGKQVGGSRNAIEQAGADLRARLAGLATDSRSQFNAANQSVNADLASAQGRGARELRGLQADLGRQGFSTQALAAEAAYQQQALRDQAATQLALQKRLGQTFGQDLGNRSALGETVTTGALDALAGQQSQAQFAIEQARQQAILDAQQAAAAAAARSRGGGGGHGGGGSSSGGAADLSTLLGGLKAGNQLLGHVDYNKFFATPGSYKDSNGTVHQLATKEYIAARSRALDALSAGKSPADVLRSFQQQMSKGAVGYRHRDIIEPLRQIIRNPPVTFANVSPELRALLASGMFKP